MRQLTIQHIIGKRYVLSKLPMRQLTRPGRQVNSRCVSKLPMRQLTTGATPAIETAFSKLPMRQLTHPDIVKIIVRFSKLPMRQLTMLERKKKPTARALIHLFPTLTQIYSCFEID